MSSEILVVIVLIAVAAVFILWVRRNDRPKHEANEVENNNRSTDGTR